MRPYFYAPVRVRIYTWDTIPYILLGRYLPECNLDTYRRDNAILL